MNLSIQPHGLLHQRLSMVFIMMAVYYYMSPNSMKLSIKILYALILGNNLS